MRKRYMGGVTDGKMSIDLHYNPNTKLFEMSGGKYGQNTICSCDLKRVYEHWNGYLRNNNFTPKFTFQEMFR